MLEQYFKLPAVLRRHRGGLLGPYLDSFVSLVGSLGYPKQTVRRQCCVLRDLALWLESEGFQAHDLDEEVVSRHIEDQRRRGRCRRGDEVATIRRFVGHLRELGIIAPPETADEDSALDLILRRYTKYLLSERAVVQVTVDYYVEFARRFLEERFSDRPLCLRDLRESDVSAFVLRWAHSQSPGRAKLLVTALRSLFRFLLAQGEIEVDLAVTVPTVANWRLSSTPRYMSAQEVERLLATCDRNTAKGCRDYAILLLLARLGFRACEVIRLELDHIDWAAGEITVCGKRYFHGRLPLPHHVGGALAEYLRVHRPKCSSRKVFIRLRAPHRGLANASSVGSIVRRALAKAGLDPVVKGAHLLRHSLATSMLRSGASMAEIGQILRHRSASTTEIYAKVDFDTLRCLAQPWPTTEVQ